MAQWFRLHAPNAGGSGSIPGRGAKILQASQRGNWSVNLKKGKGKRNLRAYLPSSGQWDRARCLWPQQHPHQEGDMTRRSPPPGPLGPLRAASPGPNVPKVCGQGMCIHTHTYRHTHTPCKRRGGPTTQRSAGRICPQGPGKHPAPQAPSPRP